MIGDVAAGTDATVNVGSPVLGLIESGTASGAIRLGGGAGGARIIVLKPSTDYVFRTANVGTVTASNIVHQVSWAEKSYGA